MTGTGPAEGAVAAEDEGEDLAALFDASESDAPPPYRICAPPSSGIGRRRRTLPSSTWAPS